MKPIRVVTLICSLSIAALLAGKAAAGLIPIVSAGADTDTKIRIGKPGYQHEVLHDFQRLPYYAEANRHSTLGGGAAEAEAHARRFHIYIPWPINQHIIYERCWVRTRLRDDRGPKSAKGKASAWGSAFIVNGPDGDMAELRGRIPGAAAVSYDPPPAGIPTQGMYADSFFDVFFDVGLSITSPTDGSITDLLKGGAHLYGPDAASPGITLSGDLVGADISVADVTSASNLPRKLALIEQDFLSPVTFFVPTNTPFEADFNMTVEAPEHEFDVDLADGVEVGTAAALAVQLELVDQSGTYELNAVPEPASGVLLAVGVLCLIARVDVRRKWSETCRHRSARAPVPGEPRQSNRNRN